MELSQDVSRLEFLKKEQYLVMISFFLSLLAMGGIWSSISIFIPLIQEEFNIDLVQSSLFFVVMLLPIPFSGLIAKPFRKMGIDIVVLVGSSVLSIFGFLHPFIPSFPFLLLVRFCAASGFGLLFMYHNPILERYVDRSQNARNTLLLMSGLVTGAFGSAYFSIYLYVLFNESWQLAVAFWGGIGLIATGIWCLYLFLRRNKEEMA